MKLNILKIKYKFWYKHLLFYDKLRIILQKKEFIRWENNGKPIPPPHIVKQKIIKDYATKYHLPVFVETGTYFGDMVFATRNIFTKIYSIELNKTLYAVAKKKFAKFPHITLKQGDSGQVISEIIEQINQPCLFWLDGHSCGNMTTTGITNTPIMQEITHILNHPIPEHVILIDDAREFTGEHDYPKLDVVKDFVFTKRSPDEFVFEVKYDIIRIHKKLKV
jgi:hypothetical protein